MVGVGHHSASASHAPSGPAIAAAPDLATISDAYIYLLGRVLVIRQEHSDRQAKGFAYNTIRYNPLHTADFVNPNFDVAYIEGWAAVDARTAAILDIPNVRGRYYTAQILDEWGEVIVNINDRTFPSRPFGKFALVAPGSLAAVPMDAARIELHSRKAKLLGRVELRSDPDGAVEVQRKFRLTSLGDPVIASPPEVPAFENGSLPGVEIFDHAEEILASALDVSPVAAEMQQKVHAVADHVVAGGREKVGRLIRSKVVQGFEHYVFNDSAPYRNHWIGGGAVGNYGKDFRLRTCVNYAGIWANSPDEVLYFLASKDADEKSLSGSSSYVMHFPAGSEPDVAVDGYWSVSLVGMPDCRVAPNDLQRYNFNTYSGLAREPDGSLRIGFGPTPVPGLPESNWLPTPKGKPFSLTFRTYVPRPAVKSGEWLLPPVTKVSV